jgi:hypothetical protein
MAKPNLQQLLNEAQTEPVKSTKAAIKAAEVERKKESPSREVHKPDEVNISAYFPREVKSALRLVQAKTGKNVKQCLGEALADYFRKHNVPVTVPME